MAYKRGDWKAICDRCGREFLASQLRSTYDGLRVCSKDWEPQHPQELIKPLTREGLPPPWTRPESDGVERLTCTMASSSAYPGAAMPGCARPGYAPDLSEILPFLGIWPT